MSLMIISLVFLILLGVLIFWTIWGFNRLIRQRNRLKEGWSGIDVQLKRRHDLVPSLVETVKGYQKHEKELLEDVTRHRAAAREASNTAEANSREKVLSSDIGRILMLAEAYPDLKADGQFLKLGAELVKIEDDLQFARRYYNGCARDMNNLVETFPSMLIAKMGGFKGADFFELENTAEGLPPDLGKAFGSSTAN